MIFFTFQGLPGRARSADVKIKRVWLRIVPEKSCKYPHDIIIPFSAFTNFRPTLIENWKMKKLGKLRNNKKNGYFVRIIFSIPLSPRRTIQTYGVDKTRQKDVSFYLGAHGMNIFQKVTIRTASHYSFPRVVPIPSQCGISQGFSRTVSAVCTEYFTEKIQNKLWRFFNGIHLSDLLFTPRIVVAFKKKLRVI